jgi:hypothetical protein
MNFVSLSKTRLNTGVMLVRNTIHAKALLEAVWANTEFLQHGWWEQAALMDCLGHRYELTGDPNSNTTVEQFAAHVGALPNYLNCMPAPDNMHGTECMDPVIVHLAAVSDRMEFARAALKNNLKLSFSTRKATKYPYVF